MAILDRSILEKHGPYIDFCIIDTPFNEKWPDRALYEGGLFIEFADCLLGIYCSMTQSYAPFDQYEFIQLKTPHQIYEFSSALLAWEAQLAKTPENYFQKELQYISPSESYLCGTKYTREQFKADLLETLHFMIGKLHHAAISEKCVVIAGI